MTRSKVAPYSIIALGWACYLPATSSANLPALGEVRGIVVAAATGFAIRGAQVWVVGRPVGATTDTLGEFRFPFHYGSQFTLVTRICGRDNAARTSVDFFRPLSSPVRIPVTEPSRPCAPLLRPPWDVGPQDTTIFEGRVYSSWEGDAFITCDGKLFSPQWAPGLLTRLWKGRQPGEGESLFVRVQARHYDDPLTRDLVGGAPLYVWRLLDVQRQAPANCEHR